MNVMLGNCRNAFRNVEDFKQNFFPWRVFLADEFPVAFKIGQVGNLFV
jgi:hypothetical protein